MTILAYVLITMQSGGEKEVLKRISNFKEIIEANLIVGEFDAVVKVEDISELDKFLTDKLRALPDVFLTTTMIITQQFK
jgi:DNA-binding Lrp family transcriptional regulator